MCVYVLENSKISGFHTSNQCNITYVPVVISRSARVYLVIKESSCLRFGASTSGRN